MITYFIHYCEKIQSEINKWNIVGRTKSGTNLERIFLCWSQINTPNSYSKNCNSKCYKNWILTDFRRNSYRNLLCPTNKNYQNFGRKSSIKHKPYLFLTILCAMYYTLHFSECWQSSQVQYSICYWRDHLSIRNISPFCTYFYLKVSITWTRGGKRQTEIEIERG